MGVRLAPRKDWRKLGDDLYLYLTRKERRVWSGGECGDVTEVRRMCKVRGLLGESSKQQ